MIGIVIVAHGGLAREYLAALEHVVGPLAQVAAVSIEADHDRSNKRSEIREAIQSVDKGEGVVIVTDLFGGSPSNLSLSACEATNRAVLYGANLPMLVKLAKVRHRPMNVAVAAARDAGRKYLDSFDPPRPGDEERAAL